MTKLGVMLGLCLTIGAGVPAMAQGVTPREQRLERQRIRQQRRQEMLGQQQPGANANRQQLVQALQRKVYQVVKTRVGLDDGQMQKLQGVNRQFAPRRKQLNEQERALRQSLRAEMTSASPDQQKIEQEWKQLRGLQRQRLDILDEEDAQLASFMTPLQRARYHAIQEQVRRQVEQRAAGGAGAAANRPLADSAAAPPR